MQPGRWLGTVLNIVCLHRNEGFSFVLFVCLYISEGRKEARASSENLDGHSRRGGFPYFRRVRVERESGALLRLSFAVVSRHRRTSTGEVFLVVTELRRLRLKT